MTFRETHNHAGSRWEKATPTYTSWKHMKDRCLNPRAEYYPQYGGRGIQVCERWLKFENFLADMGERPTGLSLERINNNGNYEPGNCRWATPRDQALNRRNSRINRRKKERRRANRSGLRKPEGEDHGGGGGTGEQ